MAGNDNMGNFKEFFVLLIINDQFQAFFQTRIIYMDYSRTLTSVPSRVFGLYLPIQVLLRVYFDSRASTLTLTDDDKLQH